MLATLLITGAILAAAAPAPAGVGTATNACLVSANQRFSDVDITVAGSASSVDPARVDLGATVVDVPIPEHVHLELYDQGYYFAGSNGVGVSMGLTIGASKSVEGEQTVSGTSFIGVTIVDPDGVKNTGDETATADPISLSLPGSAWTPTGGSMDFAQTRVLLVTSHFFGTATVGYDCVPGTTTDRLTAESVPAPPFETILPAEAPSCAGGAFIGGKERSVVIDVPARCSDANGDLEASSVQVVTPPTAGTLTVAADGIVTYTNTDPDVGSDSFAVTISDSNGLVSEPATMTIKVQPLRLMEQSGDLVTMSEATLDGESSVTTAQLSTITVVNDTSSGSGFTVSAYGIDLGTPEAPTSALDLNGDGTPDLTVPDCEGADEAPARTCIASANVGWSPRADIVVDGTPDTTASIEAGPSSAASATDWLDKLRTGAAPLALDEPRVLCSSSEIHAAGTFTCDADLYLAIPASAGQGVYTGYVVITIV